MTRSGSQPRAYEPGERRWKVRYAVLTLTLFVPLVLAFVFVRNLYPIAASTMMRSGGDLPSGKTYYILRGETLAGEPIDLPPVGLTNALSEVTWVLVRATVDNKSFDMRSPHPANAALIEAAGGRESLPRRKAE